MTNKIPFLLVAVCIKGSACNSETKVAPETNPVTNTKVEEGMAQNTCYRSIFKRDTVTLQFEVNNNIVTGNLVYNLFEKDKNSGVITGQMKGDTLLVEYTFMSEGMNSVREVAFLKKGNNLVEGYDDMVEKDGKLFFKNTSALKFENKIILIKEDCTEK